MLCLQGWLSWVSLWVCVCVCVCEGYEPAWCGDMHLLRALSAKAPTAAQGRVTSAWCGGETRGGICWANTQPGGRPSHSYGGWVVRSRAPPLAGHRGVAMMAQGGLHRGLADCEGLTGHHMAQPAPGLVVAVCGPASPGSHFGPSWGTGSWRTTREPLRLRLVLCGGGTLRGSCCGFHLDAETRTRGPLPGGRCDLE